MPLFLPLFLLLSLPLLLAFSAPAGAAEKKGDLSQPNDNPVLTPVALDASEKQKADAELLSFSAYKPVYFLVGDPDTKVQFSFKAKILRSFDLYMGYTQLLMWQIFKTSAPMRDINYNPEFFYRLYIDESNIDRRLDLGIIEHESNGIGTDNSRSWNRSYVRYRTQTKLSDSSSLYWSFKAWVPYTREKQNRDLQEYRGLWELNLEFSNVLGKWFYPGDVIVRLYGGGKSYINPAQGAQEITLRVKLRWQQLLLPVMVQFFHGYGESLLDYKQETLAIRGGVGF